MKKFLPGIVVFFSLFGFRAEAQEGQIVGGYCALTGCTMSGALIAGAGSATTPGVATGIAGTGMYSAGTTGLGFAVDGTSKFDYGITNAGIVTFASEIQLPASSFLQVPNTSGTGATTLAMGAYAGNSFYTVTIPRGTYTLAGAGIANTFSQTQTFADNGTWSSSGIGSLLALGIGGSASYPLEVQNTSTVTSGTVINSDIAQTMNQGGASSATVQGIGLTLNMEANQNLTGTAYGINNIVEKTGTGTDTLYYGIYSVSENTTTGTLTTAEGLFAGTQNLSSGTLTTGVAISVQEVNSGGGTCTTCYGMQINKPVGATSALTSTWTNIYGLYINDQNPSGAGTNTLSNAPIALNIISQTATGAVAIQTGASGLVSLGGTGTITSSDLVAIHGQTSISGHVYMTGLTAGSGSSALCLNSSGSQVESDTSATICGISALRYKNLLPKTEWVIPQRALESVLNWRTPAYRYKSEYQDHGQDVHISLIADDVSATNHDCATYNSDGQVENYADRCVEAYLVASIKQLKREFDAYRAAHP